jgi:hypothetical protein
MAAIYRTLLDEIAATASGARAARGAHAAAQALDRLADLVDDVSRSGRRRGRGLRGPRRGGGARARRGAVTSFEANRVAGGRAARVEYRGTLLDNGQHLLLGAYRDTLALMRSGRRAGKRACAASPHARDPRAPRAARAATARAAAPAWALLRARDSTGGPPARVALRPRQRECACASPSRSSATSAPDARLNALLGRRCASRR